MGAMTQLETSATTPSGDTMDAGAKPYAKKLPISPTVTRTWPSHQDGDLRYVDATLSPSPECSLQRDRSLWKLAANGSVSPASVSPLPWPLASRLGEPL